MNKPVKCLPDLFRVFRETREAGISYVVLIFRGWRSFPSLPRSVCSVSSCKIRKNQEVIVRVSDQFVVNLM